MVALLIGDPAVAFALLTLRPNLWYDGPVALLDEFYVGPRCADEVLARHCSRPPSL